MRDIHHHPQAVISHHLPPKIEETLWIGGRLNVSAQECGLCVSRSESDTQLKIGSQHGQIGVDHVPALHAHQDGDCPKPAG
jgi:hypothetical protein